MSNQHPVVDKVVDIFGNWLRHRREVRELHQLDSGEFAKIARELDMAPADLDTLVHRGPHAADELPQLLTSLGLDKDLISRTQPVALRDMERVCSSCQQKRKCDRDLKAGRSAQHYDEYCLNASAIIDLNLQAD
jgi:hypothetical protein